tara:strand:- start:126 stop:530 length:405 start_codon:yes stop_codon:yes gene_type:complete
MLRKLSILLILAVILGMAVYLMQEKRTKSIKEVSTTEVIPDKKICDGKGNCTTESEYQKSLQAKDYKCKYYIKYIWSESERSYGKKQYKYTEEKLLKINTLKEEGKALCDSGKLKEGEAILEEAIKIINFTMLN